MAEADILASEAQSEPQMTSIPMVKGNHQDWLIPVTINNGVEYIVENLCTLFNQSLTQGVMPLDFKLDRVTPIFKKKGVQKMILVTTDPYHAYHTSPSYLKKLYITS